MTKTGFALAIAVFVLGIRVQANAQPGKPAVSFAVIELTPYGMHKKDGTPYGYFYESARALLKDTRLTHSISLLPLKRLIRELDSKRTDCVYIARTHLAESKLRMIAPLGKDIIAGVVPIAGQAIRNYEDLKRNTIGVPIGVQFNKRFETDPALNRVTTVDYGASVEMLLRHRISATAGNIDSYRYFASKSGRNPDDVFGEPFVFERIPIWLGCGQDNPGDDVIDRLAKSMRKLHENGAFQKIIDNYQ